ncbi:uncharacterized protein LOC129809453 [Phlebotomus papatasi]|uniref:uncharacterized protein LOC129809453 n=1 Tax=Phlebotomus papatasi TaxID=29031 RepID=UPI0024834F28|nr:uncharacterized protein LOC129809453 [Phlebotomus papatasi]
MANFRNNFVQIMGGEEAILNYNTFPIIVENMQYLIHQYDVRSIVDARISIMTPYMVFSPQHSSTLNQSDIIPQAPQTFGEKMQTEGYYFPLHYDKGTSTNDMYVQSPATCQSIGVNTMNPTSGGIIQNLLEDSLNHVKVLNAQQMMKRRKEMDINFM